MRKIVLSAHNRAIAILDRNRDLLEEGSHALLAKETLAEPGLKELFVRVRKDGGTS